MIQFTCLMLILLYYVCSHITLNSLVQLIFAVSSQKSESDCPDYYIIWTIDSDLMLSSVQASNRDQGRTLGLNVTLCTHLSSEEEQRNQYSMSRPNSHRCVSLVPQERSI